MNGFFLDLRFACRYLLAKPGTVVAALLVLALGAGASVAIFSVIYAVALQPLPYPAADRLVALRQTLPGVVGEAAPKGFEIRNVREMNERSKAIEGISAYRSKTYTLEVGAVPVQLDAHQVTPDLFRTLRVGALLGRTFTPEEVDAGDVALAVLSHHAWQRYFGGDEEIVGRSISLDGGPVTVVGVMPPDFYFPDRDTELWTPLLWQPPADSAGMQTIVLAPTIGRIADGVTLEQAEEEGSNLLAAMAEEGLVVRPMMRPAARQRAAAGSGGNRNGEHRVGMAVERRIESAAPAGSAPKPEGLEEPEQAEEARLPQPRLELETLREQQIGSVRPALRLLGGAVVLVLLIATSNVSSLILARGLARRRELATRVALGASRVELGRLLALEGLLLAGAGTILGLPLAALALRLMRRLDPGRIPHFEEIGLHPPVLLFAIALMLFSAVVMALLPMVTLRFGRLAGSLGRDAMALPSSGLLRGRTQRQLLRSVMTTGQVALAIVLLVGAGLLGRSFLALIAVDPGFHTDGVLTAQLAPPMSQYPPGPARAQLLRTLLERARAIPGVEHAGLVNFLPMSGSRMVLALEIEGESTDEDPINLPQADLRVASDGFFEAMGIPLVAGRLFDTRDREGAERAVIISESLAREGFSGGSPIGRRIGDFGRVVGVVGDVRQQSIDRDAEGTLYLPMEQLAPQMAPLVGRVSMVLRGSDPEALAPALRTQVSQVDAHLAIDQVALLADRLSKQVAQPRFFATLLSIFAGIALLLAGLGLYSLLSYAVTQQTRETGIRMALGAQRRQVLAGTLWQGLRLTLVGLALGLGATFFLRNALSDFLFATTLGDPGTYVAVIALLLLSAVSACWFPARRAASADPVRSLRHE